MKLPTSSRFLFLAGVVVSSPGYLDSQSVIPQVAQQFIASEEVLSDLIQQKNRLISIHAKDRSIESVLREILQKSDIRLFFSPGNPELQKKITISLDSVTPLDAVNLVLRTTKLIVGKTADGQGLMIRSASDTTRKSSAVAGSSSIVGVVTDSSGTKPISGVTVILTGRNNPEITNEQGIFRFDNVSPGDRQIMVRMLGFKSQSINILVEDAGVATPRIRLSASATSLSEVVTTATGQQRRVEIAHDIAKISPEKIMERTPVRTVADILEAAQIPGVLVQRQSGDPGSPTKIRIRGIGSISQSNDPVVILDGVWIDASTSRPSKLDDIDPASIETIEVIRGPSAATLFGQDASNGVIVITSKKGQAGPTRWNLSYNRDWGQTYGSSPLLHKALGTQTGIQEPQWCPIPNVISSLCRQDSVISIDPNNRLFSREGTETNNRYTVQVDGGAQNVTYSLTASTGNTIGVRRRSGIENIRYGILGYVPSSEFNSPSELKRSSLTTTLAINPASNVTLGLTLTGSQSSLRDNNLRHSWGLSSASFSGGLSLDTAFYDNPLRMSTIYADESPLKTTSGIISSSVQYRPGEIFVINGNFGVEKTARKEFTFSRETFCSLNAGCADTTGRASDRSEDKSVYTLRLNASTSLNLGALNRFLDIRPSVGGDYRKTDQHNVEIYKKDIPVGMRTISTGNLERSLGAIIENATAGWYLNSTIGLFKRIYFDVGVRQDVGSAIASSKDAIYPKIGGSWLVSDESFWRQNRIVNSFRLRSAIGHAAVQPDMGDIYGKYVNGVEFIDGHFINTADLTSIGNQSLQPERAVEMEIGFDLDALGNRLNLIGTYAHKLNKNTLIERSIPSSLGPDYFRRKENIARVRNRNFELSANGRIIERKNMLLILNYALTMSDNIVSRLGNGIGPFATLSSRIEEGYPIAGVWTRALLGYRDINGDGLIGQDEVVLSDSASYVGWTQPRYRASYGISFTLNNQFVFDSRFAYQSRYVQRSNRYTTLGSEDINAPLDQQALTHVFSHRPISDLRWNSASITYHIPKSVLARIGGRSMSVSLQGNNLNLWSNYIGRDPGVNSGLLAIEEQLYDDGATPPRPRLFVLDFKLGF